jgi:hypothetical protein
VSSRLVRNGTGKPQFAVVTMPSAGQPVGATFAVIGDDLTEVAIGWTGTPTGRPPQPEEMTGHRTAARSTSTRVAGASPAGDLRPRHAGHDG